MICLGDFRDILGCTIRQLQGGLLRKSRQQEVFFKCFVNEGGMSLVHTRTHTHTNTHTHTHTRQRCYNKSVHSTMLFISALYIAFSKGGQTTTMSLNCWLQLNISRQTDFSAFMSLFCNDYMHKL